MRGKKCGGSGKLKAQKKGLINQTPIYNPKINLE
jgi:hypothetical protein